jgi:hypothetical protein
MSPVLAGTMDPLGDPSFIANQLPGGSMLLLNILEVPS